MKLKFYVINRKNAKSTFFFQISQYAAQRHVRYFVTYIHKFFTSQKKAKASLCGCLYPLGVRSCPLDKVGKNHRSVVDVAIKIIIQISLSGFKPQKSSPWTITLLAELRLLTVLSDVTLPPSWGGELHFRSGCHIAIGFLKEDSIWFQCDSAFPDAWLPTITWPIE